MSNIYKEHQYTLPIGINARQLAKEKKTKHRKASYLRVLFADLCTHIQLTLDLFTKYIPVLFIE